MMESWTERTWNASVKVRGPKNRQFTIAVEKWLVRTLEDSVLFKQASSVCLCTNRRNELSVARGKKRKTMHPKSRLDIAHIGCEGSSQFLLGEKAHQGHC